MIRTYFQMLIEEDMPGAAGKMKQFASWFTHGVRNGGALRKAVYEAREEREILERVDAVLRGSTGAAGRVEIQERDCALSRGTSVINLGASCSVAFNGTRSRKADRPG